MTPFETGLAPRPFCDAPRLVRRRTPGPCRPALRTFRAVPEETAIAFAYESASYAVMMATPADLADFAVGFSLTEGIIGSARDIETLETVSTPDGIMLRMSLAHEPAAAYWERRRRLAGPSGCGLCGLESLADAMRSPPPVTGGARISHNEIFDAMAAFPSGSR
jgi:FdhD protein